MNRRNSLGRAWKEVEDACGPGCLAWLDALLPLNAALAARLATSLYRSASKAAAAADAAADADASGTISHNILVTGENNALTILWES